jgi:hypothetical protein
MHASRTAAIASAFFVLGASGDARGRGENEIYPAEELSGDFWLRPFIADVLPTNARVSLVGPRNWRIRDICTNGVCAAGQFELELRMAPEPGASPVPVAVALQEVPYGTGEAYRFDRALIDLVPAAPLARSKRYEVLLIERRGRAPRRLLGSFATGTGPDTKPPTWNGRLAAQLFRWPLPPDSRKAQDAASEVARDPEEYTLVTGDPPVDDTTSPGKMRYAVWVEGRKGLDLSAPPDSVSDSASTFEQWELRLPSVGEDAYAEKEPLRFGGKKDVVRIALRAYDAAGNTSPPIEVSVDLGQPKEAPRY